MRRRNFTSALLSAGGFCGLAAWVPVRAAGLTEGDAALGVRAALERGANVAVALLGRQGGFLDNPKVRIPLPGFLDDAAKLLRFTGQQQRVDELVTAMNRAAEAAVPQARTLLVNAVKAMSVEDARKILTEGDDSVTRFFVSKTGHRWPSVFCRSSRRRPKRSRWPTSTTASRGRSRRWASSARTTPTSSAM